MQCPACGYEGIAEDVVFCPHCRYQFREVGEDIYFEDLPSPAYPARHECAMTDQKLSKKEIQLAKIQLLQPVVILILVIAGALYLSSPRVGQLSIMVSTLEIFYGSILCLVTGAVIAGIFYLVVAHRIGRS
jgi:hypothetical protein